MSIWSNNGKLNTSDTQVQRPSFGTVGSEHVVGKSLGSQTFNSLIDDQDSRITYGYFNGSGLVVRTSSRAATFDYNGSTTWLETINAAAVFNFSGTSIAVMARTNVNSGSFAVYIDGVLSNGRILINGTLSQASYGSTPLSATATSIVLTAITFLNGATSGDIMIGGEHITFSGITGTTLTGCVRSTSATAHVWTEMVYVMASTVPCYMPFAMVASDFSNGRIMYYNPFLEPGQHKIIIVVVNNASATQQGFWFDGFIVGALIGASHVSRQVGVVQVAATTNASGAVELGSFSTRTGVAVMGILGWNIPDTGGGAYPVIECRGNGDSGPSPLPDGTVMYDYGTQPAYLLLGTALKTYIVQIIFSYIGESI